jgi:hypothetical protein
LFYGLTQAARALAAAGLAGGDWEGLPGHGLHLLKPDLRLGARPDLHRIVVRDEGRCFIQQVAEMLGSPTIPIETTLAALLASLPERDELFLDDLPEPGPLVIAGGMENFTRQNTDPTVSLAIGPLPSRLLRFKTRDGVNHTIPPSTDEVHQWLSIYPRLAVLGPPSSINFVNPGELPGEFRVHASWRVDGPLDIFAQMRWCADRMDVPELTLGSSIPESGFVLPPMPGNDRALHPLITWWIVLYTLSMLARYYPRFWLALLDADQSPWSVPISAVIEIAQTSVPRLLVEELSRFESTADA